MFSAYDAARHGAALVDRTAARGRIIVAGPDRASYLQGLLTNDIAALSPGRGCYAAMLTPQGRLVSDLWVYELGDVILVSLPRETGAAILAKLDQFIFSENVQLGEVTGTFAQLAVVGPASAAAVASLLDAVGEDVLRSLPEHGNLRASIQAQPAIVTRVSDAGADGFDVYVDEAQRAGIVSALAARHVIDATGQAAEILRVEAGVPLFGRDMDAETIPLEAGIETRAISFTKGCYVGQEVIIRVLHRGHGRVARRLVGVLFDPSGAVPAPGAVIRSGDREVGHVTSAVHSPALERPIALGYVHRDFVAPGTSLTVGAAPATVVDLPFVA